MHFSSLRAVASCLPDVETRIYSRLQINFMTMIPATACRVLSILLRPSCTYRPTFQLPSGLEVVGGSGC